MDRYLNVIALNIPYPPNYGGIIDIYYKLKALHAIGVKIILHCFEYERKQAPELETLCEKVYYYKRRTGLLANITLLPYNVYSRKNPELIHNLLANDYPILFEGLHSCYYMNDLRLKDRFKIYRESNIEHDYYKYLGIACKEVVKKCFLFIESWRFKNYQKNIKSADLVLTVSKADTVYLRQQFPGKQIEFMTSFHPNDRISTQLGESDFILYHGKLSVIENEHAALYLIKNVFSQLKHTCVIAGMDPSRVLFDAAKPYANIIIDSNPSEGRMNSLMSEAQINMLVTFQDTGLKLKLLNSLFAGRHIVVNQLMLTGTDFAPLCHVTNTLDEMIRTCNELMKTPIDEQMIRERDSFLDPAYSNKYQAERLNHLIYGEK